LTTHWFITTLLRDEKGRLKSLSLLGIAVFSAAEEALQEFAAGGLAGFRVGEVDLQPDLLRHLVGGAEDLLRFRREGRHVLAAARAGADQHQAPDQLTSLQRDLLGDEAADRETEHINLLQSQRLDEGDGVGAHLLERGRHLARAVGNARVVEQDHLPRRREAVGHQRVPVVHRAGEMHVEDERHTTRFAEASVSEPNTSRVLSARSGDCAGSFEIPSLWPVALKPTREAVESGRRPDAAKAARRVPREDRPLTGRGANLRARTGSVSGVTAVDVEDMAGDE
jgi:hypothetical protein